MWFTVILDMKDRVIILNDIRDINTFPQDNVLFTLSIFPLDRIIIMTLSVDYSYMEYGGQGKYLKWSEGY